MTVRYSNRKTNIQEKLNFPVAIINEVKPVFQELSDVKMLEKCLHGTTRNCNESFNQLIWNRCPKNIFTSKKIVEIAVNSPIINYNDGLLSINHVFDSLGFPAGRYFFFNANQKDDVHLKNMGRNSLEKNKKRRKTLRSQRKGFIDLERENEGGDAYRAGECEF